jgi:hypothetical protein
MGLAASLLQDDWKSIGGGVFGVVVGSMRPDYAVIRCRMEWKTSAMQKGEEMIVINRLIGRGACESRVGRRVNVEYAGVVIELSR